MPHIIVKLWPGKRKRQKARLAEAITESVASVLGYDDDSVSVTFEEVSAAEWVEKVCRSDIVDKPEQRFKKPGYST